MSTLTHTLRREVRVAFSRQAQPVWFRVTKWIGVLAGIALFHDRPWFWWSLAGVAVAGFGLHFFYRWKTKHWTRAWGGWNDLEAGRD
jgi:hypothetical protein